MYLGNFTRGIAILISALVIGFVSFFALSYFGIIPSIIFYVWQIFDANSEYNKRKNSPVEGNIICRNCDSPNSVTSEFCSKCGIRIQNNCPFCNNPNILNSPYCGKCGNQLN